MRPAEAHGTGIIAFAVFHAGDPEAGRKAIEPVRHFGMTLGEHIGVQPYRARQRTFDPLLTPGARNYWKSHNFADLATWLSMWSSGTSATSRHRTARSFLARSAAPPCGPPPTPRHTPIATPCTCAASTAAGKLLRKTRKAWSGRGSSSATRRRTPRGGVYVNFLTDDESDRVKAAYGPNYRRLAEIKKKYDPRNLFRINRNIRPELRPAA